MAQIDMFIIEHECNNKIFGGKNDWVFLRQAQIGLGETTSYMEEPVLAKKW